jgi:hypothetical protein
MDDEIIRESLIARGGEVTNARIRQALGLPEASPASPVPAPATAGSTTATTEG